jgi:Oxidoreductase molybdopterin binding domain
VPKRTDWRGTGTIFQSPRAFVQFNMIAANHGRPLTLHCSSLALAVAFFGLYPAISGQTASTLGTIVEGKLTIGLLDKSPQVVERSDIAKLTHKTIKVKGSGSRPSIYSGVPLKEVLELAGAVFSVERKQANLGSIVVVESVDAPSAIFAMAELDSALTSKQILLADSKEGKPLAIPEGPFRIIVPDEKEPARWVKQVWAIYIVQISRPSKQP